MAEEEVEKSDDMTAYRLRLAKLNEEMKHEELGNPNEELLQDMVRNFWIGTS